MIICISRRFRDQLRDVTPTTAAIDSIEESITVEDGTHTNETATVEVDMNLDFLLKDLSISNTEVSSNNVTCTKCVNVQCTLAECI